MTCPECGAAVDAEARFCPRCGTALLAGPDEEPLSPAGDDDPQPWVEDTSDLDELLPFGAYPDVDRPGGRYAAGPADDEREPRVATDPDSRRGCIGMVALAVVGLLMLVGLLWYFGSDEPDAPAAAPTASSTVASTPGGSPSEEASPSATGPSPTQRASTAKKCAEAEGATAWSGNEVTTCDFAIETARALVAAGGTLPATVTANSPVTKQDYRMECSNTTPVVCRGGNDALVYVDLPQD
ncbi:zinc-ribbon domain-containing protein [Phycicoccus avicenniae]|uniref:zinc-ribbon domain-containing protein n=1 Tax=Phycicoccus avicenniae TaxID=2828860 RepID=UPI003D2A05D4